MFVSRQQYYTGLTFVGHKSFTYILALLPDVICSVASVSGNCWHAIGYVTGVNWALRSRIVFHNQCFMYWL